MKPFQHNRSGTSFILTFVLLFGAPLFSQAQQAFWQQTSENRLTGSGKRFLFPKQGRFLEINFAALKQKLAQAPAEQTKDLRSYGMPLSLPMPDGSVQEFAVASYQMLEKPLAEKNPDIRTFLGQGITDPTAQVFLDFTLQGFHAQILSANGSYYIDPVFLNETKFYTVYDRTQLQKTGTSRFQCGISEAEFRPENSDKSGSIVSPSIQTTSGTLLRTYRLALAATAEYTIFQGGTKPLALSAMTTTMNRVNGIYNRDVTVRFNIIANTDVIIYTANPDPYTNGNASAMMGENQSTVDGNIGAANYDIGHVFGTNSGGVVSGRVCTNGNKARGVTGSGAPIGDPFDVDYVAHEMGHQCNAPHTWNGTQSNCSAGQYASSAAVEPGSGITIMGYAGICGSDDLAPNSIDHFHNKSQQDIIAFTQTGSGNSCGTGTATGNSAPAVSISSPASRTIPISTPYELTGAATDANGDALTYCWEQSDLGAAGPPNVASRTDGPITRSFSPTASGTRTVPQLSDILAGTNTIGNLLGTATRSMNYRFTARDNRAGGGGMTDGTYTFNVTSTAGPFLVTSHNSTLVYAKNQPTTITWSVANTNVAPVNCTSVAILLSTDGGLTFPITLSASTANDGSETVTMPDVNTTTARIKVKALNNIFFDISNQNIQIQDYCNALGSICSDIDFGQHFISRVRLNSLDVSSSCSPNGYSLSSSTTSLTTGQTYTLQVNLGTNVVDNGVAAWIDYNNDNDFNDFGEMVVSLGPGSGLRTATFTVPGSSTFLGVRRLRVRSGYNLTYTNTQACFSNGFGETEDYNITISGYCFQTAICNDIDFGQHYISNVSFHTINNTSSCSPNGYNNYTGTVPVASVKAGQTYPISIQTSNTALEGVGVWIDYNNDLDFDDPGEFAYRGLPSISGIFSGSIRIQGLTSYYGNRRMRVRTSFNKTFSAGDACSTDGFGETEDYLINISGYCFASSICSDIDFGDHYIQNFNLAGIGNSSSGCGNSGYTLYPETQFLGHLGSGSTHSGTAIIAGGATAGQAIWIDYNNDEDFNDAGEFVTSRSTTTTSLWSFSFTVPSNPAFQGIRRLRIRSGFNTSFTSGQSCSALGFGETEDYFVEISQGVALGFVDAAQCKGSSLMVPFSTTGVFEPSNFFKVELSDSAGVFSASPTVIGTGISSPLICNIPSDVTPGNHFRIRISSSNPSGYSATSGFITIYSPPVVFSMFPTSGGPGTLVTFTGSLSGVEVVYFGQMPATPTFISPAGTTMQVVVPPGANTAEVYVSNAHCSVIGPVFTISSCDLNLLPPVVQNSSSPGCNNGSAIFTATGTFNGTGQVSLYSKIASTFANLVGTKNLDGSQQATFPALSPNLYRAILKDNSICADTVYFEVIAQPCSLDVSNAVTTSTTGSTGTISYQVTGISCTLITNLKKLVGSVYEYQNNVTPVLISGNTYQYQNLPAGVYQVRVTLPGGICRDSIDATISAPPTKVSTPVISPATGSFTAPVTVSITCSTANALIYYTTTGNNPVIGTGYTKLYSGPFTLSANTTVRALAIRNDLLNSAIAVSYLTITDPGKVQNPVISPGTGSYSGSQTVSITIATPSASIYYTTNGNVPNLTVPNSFTKLYTGPFTINATMTIRAIATKVSLTNSDVVVASITITNPSLPAAAPVITPGTGIYAGAQSVSISSATPGAVIYYTTNGNNPLLTSPNYFTKLYTGPFVVTSSATIRAIATATGFLNSGITSAFLTIGPGRENVADEVSDIRNASFRIFPNPSEGVFYLENTGSVDESLTCEILTTDGKQIFKTDWKEGNVPVRFDIHQQPAGLYLLKLTSSERSTTMRISKR